MLPAECLPIKKEKMHHPRNSLLVWTKHELHFSTNGTVQTWEVRGLVSLLEVSQVQTHFLTPVTFSVSGMLISFS